ncbi:hypothetical protein [Rhodoplanes sp. Z2-YC6860]|uniref:hypothetical protein n=1 Tax=Rhodoplanes sp. Z2-YC6860 TaxID=674703 RepID=UPI00082FBB31|nr:hypothetical protein [Rhodoplanes sp. Z2-YC6860]
MQTYHNSTLDRAQAEAMRSRADAATRLLKSAFPFTSMPVYLCTFPNERGTGAEHHIYTRHPSQIASFVSRWDKPGRGIFFCVGTVKNGQTRNKENIVETACLHADLDLDKIESDPSCEVVLRKVAQLMYQPSAIVFSGGGLHLYWFLNEAIPTQGNMERIEIALRKLADLIAGDPAVCEVSRVMRLPTSHNSKRGAWKAVELLSLEANRRYSLDDLEDWLSEAHPILSRKPREVVLDVRDICPFEEFGRQSRGRRVDVNSRLEQMTYQGGGDTSIHMTQLSCSAAMLNTGMLVDDVVAILLHHTKRAAGLRGARWNWRREEAALRHMCLSWLKKRATSADNAEAA